MLYVTGRSVSLTKVHSRNLANVHGRSVAYATSSAVQTLRTWIIFDELKLQVCSSRRVCNMPILESSIRRVQLVLMFML
jgi:hypothetical protein